MQLMSGWILVVIPGLLLGGQLVSVVNFPIAQKLGRQEKADTPDPLKLRSELFSVYRDLVSLVWLPVAGVLMLVDHVRWPHVS